MKFSLVIIISVFCCISIVHGGVGQLTPKEEKDILDLWGLYCEDERLARNLYPNPNIPEGIYCKSSEDRLEQTVNHQVTVPDTGKLGEQVVFIRPPAIKFRHNVQIQGGDGVAPKTKIFVLPQKAEHQLKSEYIPGSVATEKPIVYFLKSDGKQELHPVRYGAVQIGHAGYRSG